MQFDDYGRPEVPSPITVATASYALLGLGVGLAFMLAGNVTTGKQEAVSFRETAKEITKPADEYNASRPTYDLPIQFP